MKRYLNILKITIGLALVLMLAFSSFNQPSLVVASTVVAPIGPGIDPPQWWAEAGAAAVGAGVAGGVSGAVVGSMGSPIGVGAAAGAGAVGGFIGGFVGYAVTTIFGDKGPVIVGNSSDKIFDR